MRVILVIDVTFDGAVCIPLRQANATLFTRPFLPSCVRRGWLVKLGYSRYSIYHAG